MCFVVVTLRDVAEWMQLFPGTRLLCKGLSAGDAYEHTGEQAAARTDTRARLQELCHPSRDGDPVKIGRAHV